MYRFLVSNSTPAVYKQSFFSSIFFLQEAAHKEDHECLILGRFWEQVGCFFLPHWNPGPLLLCVNVVMSADCRLLWCLHLSSMWPMQCVWPGLIVLMVTPASSAQGGGSPTGVPHNEGDVINQCHTPNSQGSRGKLFLSSTFPTVCPVDGNHTVMLVGLWTRLFSSSFYAEAVSQLEAEVFVVSPWQQRWLQDKRISIKSSLDIVLLLFILNGCFTLQHSFNQCLRKERSGCVAPGCSSDPFSPLCTLSSLHALSFVLVF